MREQSFCSMFLPTTLVRLLIVSHNFNLDCPHKWWGRLFVQILINFIFSELPIIVFATTLFFLTIWSSSLLLYCRNSLYILNPCLFDVHLVSNHFFYSLWFAFCLSREEQIFICQYSWIYWLPIFGFYLKRYCFVKNLSLPCSHEVILFYLVLKYFNFPYSVF